MSSNRRVIPSSRLAKELLKEGFKIIDIAPHKNDHRRTVFIFENTKQLQDYLKDGKESVNAKTIPNQQNRINTNTKYFNR